jgi:hypothetical protein
VGVNWISASSCMENTSLLCYHLSVAYLQLLGLDKSLP